MKRAPAATSPAAASAFAIPARRSSTSGAVRAHVRVGLDERDGRGEGHDVDHRTGSQATSACPAGDRPQQRMPEVPPPVMVAAATPDRIA